MLTLLEQDERDKRHGREDEGPHDPRRAPAVVVRLDQRIGQREQAERGGGEAGEVEALVRLVPRLVDEEEARCDPEDADRDVHEEDPVPREVLGDETADEGPDRERQGRDTRPDPDGSAPLPRRERRGDDR